MRQVRVNDTPFLCGVSGSCTTLFRYPWARIPQSTSGVEWAEDSFHTANFGRDSRASFADYGGRMVSRFPLLIPGHDDSLFIPGQKTIPCSYQVKCAIHTSVRGVVGASWAGITLKSDSWIVCVGGAWAFVIHAFGMIPGSE